MEMSNWITEVNWRLPEDYMVTKIASDKNKDPSLAVSCRRRSESDITYPAPMVVGYDSDVDVFISRFYKELRQFYAGVEKALRARLEIEQSATCKTEFELERLDAERGHIQDARMIDGVRKRERAAINEGIKNGNE